MQPEHPGEAVVGGSTVEEDDVTEQVDMDADDSAPMDQIVEVNTNTEQVNIYLTAKLTL